MFHACRKYSRNIRSSIPRADTFVAAMAKERDCSVVCGFIDEVSSTASQSTKGVENRGARTAQVGMARAKMLASMYHRSSLVSDAGPDSVGAFDLLRPDSAQPDSPIFESICQ